MTLGEFREQTKDFDGEMLVVLSKDSEGNSYSPLANVGEMIYVPETMWYGEVYPSKLTQELKNSGCTEEDLYHGDNGKKAIVLWPTD